MFITVGEGLQVNTADKGFTIGASQLHTFCAQALIVCVDFRNSNQ